VTSFEISPNDPLPLSVEVPHQVDVAIIDLHGQINALSESALNTAYGQASGPNPRAILLNLSNVDYITSTGMAILVGLVAQAHQTGRRLAGCGLSDHYQEVFRITRMNDFMEIFPDETSALAKL
jgi:anti-sigma B factor antagonist